MNAAAPQPQAAAAAGTPTAPVPYRPAVTGRDREFLPAALEILESPPSPTAIALSLVICAFVAAALAWSIFGTLDEDAVAWGKVVAVEPAKVIQPLEPGKVARILVANGSHVKAGDVLLELDPTEANADASGSRQAMDSSLAEIARRRYAMESLRANAAAIELETPTDRIQAIVAAAEKDIAFDPSVGAAARQREVDVLRSDLDQLTSTLLDVQRQVDEKLATNARLKSEIAQQEQVVRTLTDTLKMRQEAFDKKVGSKIDLYGAQGELAKAQGALASSQGQLDENAKALKELESLKSKDYWQFIADYGNKLAEAERKADEARQTLAKADARLERTRLLSPIDGVVQQLAVTTVGQVFTTGQQLMRIAPVGGPLQVEALVENKDIGFIQNDQSAIIKVDAFPFTRFGVLHGSVQRIAPDAVDEQEAKRVLANAASAANDANASNGAAPGQQQSFVYPTTVALNETNIVIDGKAVPLSPGMTVAVEIRTGRRPIIDYFLSPIAKRTSEALHER